MRKHLNELERNIARQGQKKETEKEREGEKIGRERNREMRQGESGRVE